MKARMISIEECRLRLTEFATEVRLSGVRLGVYPVAGQPRYELAPEAGLDLDRVRSCFRIGPDRFRRHFAEIRGLALFDDIPFGLVIRGDLVAIFQRHPGYRPAIADEVRADFARHQGKMPPDLLHRISVLEAAFERLNAKLDDQSAVIRAIRQQRNKQAGPASGTR